ncbi:hypothetical protein Sjap_002206 [Stephania japonica]|uniref:Uncharacterized protein n=1 Tax=Stephania japonica TaxID=461633 RepID=A0AAP0KLN9_9MAGN
MEENFQQLRDELFAPIDDGALPIDDGVQLTDDGALSIDDGALLTDHPTEKVQDKPTDSSMNEFGNLPILYHPLNIAEHGVNIQRAFAQMRMKLGQLNALPRPNEGLSVVATTTIKALKFEEQN